MKTYQFRPAQLDRTGAARAQQYAIGQFLAEEAPSLTVDDLRVTTTEHVNAAGKTMWWDVSVEAKDA